MLLIFIRRNATCKGYLKWSCGPYTVCIGFSFQVFYEHNEVCTRFTADQPTVKPCSCKGSLCRSFSLMCIPLLFLFFNGAGGKWRPVLRLRPQPPSPRLARSSETPSPMEEQRPTPRRMWHRVPWTSMSRCLMDTGPWSPWMGGNYYLIQQQRVLLSSYSGPASSAVMFSFETQFPSHCPRLSSFRGRGLSFLWDFSTFFSNGLSSQGGSEHFYAKVWARFETLSFEMEKSSQRQALQQTVWIFNSQW